MMPRRVGAAVVLATAIALGLVVHTRLPDTAITDIAGDALYPIAIYAGIVLVAARARPAVVALVTLGWCLAVELFQLTGIPTALGARIPPVSLVLGTGFDARDLLVYGVSVAVAWIIEGMLDRGRSTRTTKG